MTPHDWYAEHRAAFVARALDAREERLFADHLGRCDECTREVTRLERELGWLPMGVTPAPPRPGLTHQLAEGVLRRRSAWRRLAPTAAAAAIAAAALGFGVHERQRGDTLAAELGRREAQLAAADSERSGQLASLAALEDTLSVMRQAQHVVQQDIAMNGHHGRLLIFQDAASHRWNVVMHGLPPAPAGEVYQFWFITGSGMVRSAELRSGGSGAALAMVSMPKVPGPVMGAALSVEPAVSRSVDQPTGPMLAHIEF
ncbi:MAG TPA: anti-sigma factor [Gemmatimonadales bacterium]|nr:anti-sigma factor [Gemmatimonadales bacterium]